MKIAVCVRQGLDGEINPFDASAYEEALRIPDAEVTLLSMGPPAAKDMLLRLTRLGAREAILLCDKAFAGADTLATAYALSLAIKKINPELVFCGRQTLVGDTAQTGAMLSVMLGYSLITNVMRINEITDKISCKTRNADEESASLPALITVERISNLRLPRLRSAVKECHVLSASDIEADTSRCGLAGSPTRVISTSENQSGRRKCKLISFEELAGVIDEALKSGKSRLAMEKSSDKKLSYVISVGEPPLEFAKSISDNVRVIPLSDLETTSEIIKDESPDAVIWGSDFRSKRLAAEVAARLELGLCADCTSLDTDGSELFMIRPALSGSVIAKIRSTKKPAMATVRTTDKDTSDIIVGIGYGAKDSLADVYRMAEKLGADIAATRKMVDNDLLPYENQVGLTGRTVAPPLYIAIGISGAVHHLAGVRQARTIIAINPDKDAPIFDYADYAVVDKIENLKI